MPDYKKRFLEGDYYEHTIVQNDGSNGAVGSIRLKPVSISWKPKSARQYYTVSLEAFADWIEKEGRRTTK